MSVSRSILHFSVKTILILAFLSMHTASSPGFWQVAQNVEGVQPVFPDTGQEISFTRTFGEDADFTSGQPSYSDNGDGTITDRVTGLIWQKTDGGEIVRICGARHASISVTFAGRSELGRIPNDYGHDHCQMAGNRQPTSTALGFAVSWIRKGVACN